MGKDAFLAPVMERCVVGMCLSLMWCHTDAWELVSSELYIYRAICHGHKRAKVWKAGPSLSKIFISMWGLGPRFHAAVC